MQETQIQSLCQEDLLEEKVATHPSIFLEIPDRGPCVLNFSPWQSQRIRHDWATKTIVSTALLQRSSLHNGRTYWASHAFSTFFFPNSMFFSMNGIKTIYLQGRDHRENGKQFSVLGTLFFTTSLLIPPPARTLQWFNTSISISVFLIWMNGDLPWCTIPGGTIQILVSVGGTWTNPSSCGVNVDGPTMFNLGSVQLGSPWPQSWIPKGILFLNLHECVAPSPHLVM